jgi:spermidine/putrescine transport system substrate-binding protein
VNGERGWGRRAFVRYCAQLGLTGTTASLLWGCVTRREPPPPDEVALPANGPLERELRIFNWSDYIGRGTLERFEQETGVRIIYDTFESNEEMVAKLVAGGSGYDLIGPTGYLVPVLRDGGLLQPLDHAALSGWEAIGAFFHDAANDPAGRYGMPYQWGMTGIAYRRDLVPPPTSWGTFAERGVTMTMLDDGREVLGAMLKWRGHSLNSTDPAEVRAAGRDARAVKANLRAYVNAPVKGQLISGDIALAQLWDGDARAAAMEEPNIQLVVPDEGSNIFTDFLAIPRSAPHRNAAHAFLRYVLRPEIALEIAEETGFGPCNEQAVELMEEPVRLPDAAFLTRMEFQADLGAATELWDRVWTEVKAG